MIWDIGIDLLTSIIVESNDWWNNVRTKEKRKT